AVGGFRGAARPRLRADPPLFRHRRGGQPAADARAWRRLGGERRSLGPPSAFPARQAHHGRLRRAARTVRRREAGGAFCPSRRTGLVRTRQREVPRASPGGHRSVHLVGERRHRQDADALFDERAGLVQARLAADRPLRLVAGVDSARHLGKLGADVVGVRFDLVPELGHHLAGLAALVVEQRSGGRLRLRALAAADDGRRHDRLVDRGRPALGTDDEPPLALLLISGAVRKPALEFVPLGAAERIFDHGSARQQRVQPARRIEIIEIVAAADRPAADENLRHSRTSARLLGHRRLRCAVAIDADFLERHALFLQQRLRGVAVGTRRFCVDDDRLHLESNSLARMGLNPHYMGGHPPVTTRAKTSTSTRFAPARMSARDAALAVAPEVSTSSTSTTFRPFTLAPSATLNAPWTFSARCARLRPTWLWVALTLISALTSQGFPVARATSRASMAAWLNRRRHSLSG